MRWDENLPWWIGGLFGLGIGGIMAFGPDLLPTWARWSLFGLCVALVLLSGCMLAVHWWRSRKSPRPHISETTSGIAPTQPLPDMTIRELFFHIRPDLLEQAEERRWETVALDVMDKASTGQLDIWGREIDRNIEVFRSALTRIDPDYWQHRVFIYHFLNNENAMEKVEGKILAHTWSPQKTNDVQYADLQVNRAQALHLWPGNSKPLPFMEATGDSLVSVRGTEFLDDLPFKQFAVARDGSAILADGMRWVRTKDGWAFTTGKPPNEETKRDNDA
jgi:hypothetical protein